MRRVQIFAALAAGVLADPDVIQQYANQGLPPQGSDSPEQFAAFLRADYERIARLVKVAGIKPE